MEYRWNKFPNFCAGVLYIMSKNTAIQLLRKFEEAPRQNYIWIEDTYLTGKKCVLFKLKNEPCIIIFVIFLKIGILLSLLAIPRINIDNAEYGQAIIKIEKVDFNDYLAGFTHDMSYDSKFELWQHHFVEHSCINKNSTDCLL